MTSAAAACQFTPGGSSPDDANDAMTPDAPICSSQSRTCDNDQLVVCETPGSAATIVPCGWGCVAGTSATPAHCANVIPAGSGGINQNGVQPEDLDPDMLLDIDLGGGISIDGDDGQIGTEVMPDLYHGALQGIDKGIDFRISGTIAVFRFRSLKISGDIRLIGTRPIALVADGPITIAGVVDARGGCLTFNPGPGGYGGGSAARQDGRAPSNTMGGGPGASSPSTGAGGGAYGTAGGSAKSEAGGVPYGEPTIPLLVGGAGGGAGDGGGSFGRGGGGGGAVQLVSNSRIEIGSGGINAGGCGGKAGIGGSDSGGGGGAGGTILLEAPTVVVRGTLAANGGGGGGGGGSNAEAGANGALGTTPAVAGAGDATDEDGGSGAATGKAATAGAGGSNPGGGGGGMGHIRINTFGGNGHELTQSILSPGPSDPGMLFSTGSAKTQ